MPPTNNASSGGGKVFAGILLGAFVTPLFNNLLDKNEVSVNKMAPVSVNEPVAVRLVGNEKTNDADDDEPCFLVRSATLCKRWPSDHSTFAIEIENLTDKTAVFVRGAFNPSLVSYALEDHPLETQTRRVPHQNVRRCDVDVSFHGANPGVPVYFDVGIEVPPNESRPVTVCLFYGEVTGGPILRGTLTFFAEDGEASEYIEVIGP